MHSQVFRLEAHPKLREFRPVYAATAGSVTLITFDVRHLPQEEREPCQGLGRFAIWEFPKVGDPNIVP